MKIIKLLLQNNILINLKIYLKLVKYLNFLEFGWKGGLIDIKSEVNLSEYLNNNIIQEKEVNNFLEYLNINSYDVIIGGCCRYGTEELNELINLF